MLNDNPVDGFTAQKDIVQLKVINTRQCYSRPCLADHLFPKGDIVELLRRIAVDHEGQGGEETRCSDRRSTGPSAAKFLRSIAEAVSQGGVGSANIASGPSRVF